MDGVRMSMRAAILYKEISDTMGRKISQPVIG